MILHIFKIGGEVVDNPEVLEEFCVHMEKIHGQKILVHGGGKAATALSEKLGVPARMVNGRRITDEETLKVVVMTYAGWINKSLTALLQSKGMDAVGLSGADGNLIRAHKRTGSDIDYGFAGDIDSVNSEFLQQLLQTGKLPVVAPITHNRRGVLLNTNADTIASEIACALAASYDVRLIYLFGKAGVLRNIEDPGSLIPRIKSDEVETLHQEGIISDGMLPKLTNAVRAVERGVKGVILADVQSLGQLAAGKTAGTEIIR